MADCYECYHYKACSNIGDSGFSYLPEDASKCRYFKHKEDVEEVVRCKDCEHGHWNQETCHGRPVYYCDRTDLQVGKYDFCSYGERRDT